MGAKLKKTKYRVQTRNTSDNVGCKLKLFHLFTPILDLGILYKMILFSPLIILSSTLTFYLDLEHGVKACYSVFDDRV